MKSVYVYARNKGFLSLQKFQEKLYLPVIINLRRDKMKIFLTFLMVLASAAAFCASSAVTEADKLIKEKKYESAYKVLFTADPENRDPEIAVAKTELCINCFVWSVNHVIFSLKDMGPGETVENTRGKNGSLPSVSFAPADVLEALIKKYPDNYKLRKALGDYYDDVRHRYPDGWLESPETVFQKAMKNYEEAYSHGEYDGQSVSNLAVMYLEKGDTGKAAPLFEKAIKLDPDYGLNYYNLSYICLCEGNYKKGTEYGEKALKLYRKPEYRGDAAELTGRNWHGLGNREKALEYYLKAHSINPDSYQSVRCVLIVKMELNHKDYMSWAEKMFLMGPSNPGIDQDLQACFREAGKTDELLKFYESKIPEYKSDNEAAGSLYFYISNIHLYKGRYAEAETSLKASRTCFEKVFKKDHEVFQAIEDGLSFIKEEKNKKQ